MNAGASDQPLFSVGCINEDFQLAFFRGYLFRPNLADLIEPIDLMAGVLNTDTNAEGDQIDFSGTGAQENSNRSGGSGQAFALLLILWFASVSYTHLTLPTICSV